MRLTQLFVRFREWRVWCGIGGKLGTRPPLLVVPGGPGMPHDYLATLALLTDDRPVVFYDPIGSGCSDRPAGVSWSLELYAEELTTICHALNLGPVHILTHSMASLIAVKALERPMPSLRSLTLASPVIDVPRYLTEVRRRVEALTGDLAAFMQAEGDTRKRTPAYAQVVHDFIGRNVCRRTPLPDCLTKGFQLVNRAAHQQMKGGLLFYTTPMARLDVTEHLSALDLPTLITCGEHDPTTPQDCAALQGRMRDCELAVLPNCSHMPHLEDSRAYAGVVGRFLDAVDQRPRA